MTDAEDLALRLAELEIHVAHRDQVIDDLNEALRGQWDEIDRLKRAIDRLADQIARQTAGETAVPAPEKPPHY